jgi:hypothetical protein
MRAIHIVIVSLLALTCPVSATLIVQEKFVCPIGGEKFTAPVALSHTVIGQQPDGMPIGTGLPDIPECPSNGLILYEEKFDKATLAKLKLAIASPEYQALRETEPQRYRLWWLRNYVGTDARDLAWLMVEASWEANSVNGQRARYQRKYVDMIRALRRKNDADWEWVYLHGRAANALRELGEFETAKSLIDSLPLSSLAIDVPKPIINPKAKYSWQQVTNQKAIDEAENRNGWAEYFRRLSVLIDNRVKSSAPITMLSNDFAASECIYRPEALTEFDKAHCKTAKIQAIVNARAEEKAKYERMEAEAAALPESEKKKREKEAREAMEAAKKEMRK